MKGCVYTGQLASVDTDSGEIEVIENDEQSYILSIDSGTRLCFGGDWENVLGENVEAIVIDDKTIKVTLIQNEE
jgi:hypothetical protein